MAISSLQCHEWRPLSWYIVDTHTVSVVDVCRMRRLLWPAAGPYTILLFWLGGRICCLLARRPLLSLLLLAGREMSSSYELRGEGLVWLIVAVLCLCAAPRVELFVSAGIGWPCMRHGITSSWQSAATSDVVTLPRLDTSLTQSRVSSAIASTSIFAFVLFLFLSRCLCSEPSRHNNELHSMLWMRQ